MINIDDYIFFDLNTQKQKPELYLATPQRRIINKIHDAFNIKYMIKLGRINELELSVPYEIEKLNDIGDIEEGVSLVSNDIIDQIKDRFLVKIKLGEYEEWFMIREQEDVSDDTRDYKQVRCFSLANELSHIKIINYHVTSYNILEILKGKPFDPIPGILQNSLWSVGYVDPALLNKYRAYDCPVKNGVEIVLELIEIFDCVPIFDTVNRLINFYDKDNVGENKGFRISRRKYLNALTSQSVADEIVTKLKVYGRDGISIRRVNPLGTDYIEDYSYFMFPYGSIDNQGNPIYYSDYMSNELCEAIVAHRTKINDYSPTFMSLITKLNITEQLSIAKNTELRNLQNELQKLRDNLRVAERGMAGGTTTQFFQGKIDEIQKQIERQTTVVENLYKKRQALEEEVATLRMQLSDKTNYTPELLEEKKIFTIENDFINNNIAEEEELYKAAIEHFNEVNKPKTSVSIEIVDFLNVLEEQKNWDKLKLGDIIRIKYENFDLEENVRIVELDYDFENENVNLVITNAKDFLFTDEVDLVGKLLHRNLGMAKEVNVSKVRWNGINRVRETLEDILSNPWETLGLEEDVEWEVERHMDRLYDEIEEIVIPEIDLPDFDAWYDTFNSLIDLKLDDFEFDLEWPEFPDEEPIIIDDYYERIAADWNSNGFQFFYAQQYSVEPEVQISFQRDEGYEGEFDTASFKPIAEHIRGEPEIVGGELIEPYIGLKVVFEGSSIPNEFSGKVSVAAVCTGLIGEEGS